MTFNNTYYALKSNKEKFLAVLTDDKNSIFIYEEDLCDHNMFHILHEFKEDAEDFLDILNGNSLINYDIHYDGNIVVDRIVKVQINYEVNVNELT